MHVRRQFQKLFFIIASAAACFFLSCAESTPELSSVTGTAVFDFPDNNSVPSVRLSLFVSTASDARRVQKITATCLKSGYQWIIDNPRVISSDGKQWAGYTNIEPRAGETLMTGKYSILYTDAAGRETDMYFTVSYPESLLTAKTDTIRTCISSPLEDTSALYDAAGQLLYFGKPKDAWQFADKVLFDYPDALVRRSCLSTPDLSIICLLPPENLKQTENDKSKKANEASAEQHSDVTKITETNQDDTKTDGQ
jgi:hypothetical protein